MRLNTYQSLLSDIEPPGADALLLLLDLGASAGSLLRTHERYLRSSLDFGVSRSKLVEDLGVVLRQLAQFAYANSLSLEDIARANLHKSRNWAIARGRPVKSRLPGGPLHGDSYQRFAAETDEFAKDGLDPLSLGVPILGLAGETGTLLVAQKKFFRDDDLMARDPDFLKEELGDLLWYVASVARHTEVSLNALIHVSLDRAQAQRVERDSLRNLPPNLPILDAYDLKTERLPRRLVFRFRQSQRQGKFRVNVTLTHAYPNPFPSGPVSVPNSDKQQGFAIPQPIGDNLTNNSHYDDAYRFHDALHLGFLAVMGWSPLMRSLLGVKRRSQPVKDENEDGARAIFAEEGLAAVIAKRSVDHQGFVTELSVDDETVEMMATVLEDLEAAQMPVWLWKRAISQGFVAMSALTSGRGGFLDANLDRRTLTYSRTNPVAS